MRTNYGGKEDDGGEENMPLHVERFVREEILLDYLFQLNLINDVVCSRY